MSPRMTRESKERRFRLARKVEAQIEFLEEPFRWTIKATCGVCGQCLGWWDRTRPAPAGAASEGSSTLAVTPDWHTDPYVSMGDTAPDEEFRYSYSGYPDTGYEVQEVHVRFGPDLRPQRISSTGGLVSRGGERIGRRRRTTDALVPGKIDGYDGPVSPYPRHHAFAPHLLPGRVEGPGGFVTEGQIVVLPANVFCPACKRDTLNSIPIPSVEEKAV